MKKIKKLFMSVAFVIVSQANATESTLPEYCHNLPTEPKELKGAPAECYNRQTFVLDWKPETCYGSGYTAEGCDNLSSDYAGHNFSLHGLWFDLLRDEQVQYLTSCEPMTGFYPQNIDVDLWQDLSIQYPLHNLASLLRREWRSNGVCSGMLAQDHFSVMMSFHDQLGDHSLKKISRYAGKSVTQANLDKIFDNGILTWCNADTDGKQYITKIGFHYDEKYNSLPVSKDVMQESQLCDVDKPINIRKVSEYQELQDHIDMIKESPSPINVAFSVDDVLLFSQPAFTYAYNTYGKDFFNNKRFWKVMNNVLDRFNLPKEGPINILRKHVEVGNKVYIVSGRKKTAKESLSDRLRKVTGIESLNDVIFTSGSKNKHKYLKKYDIDVFYGSSDLDMAKALSVKAIPYRILSLNTEIHSLHSNPGRYGETVIGGTRYSDNHPGFDIR